MTAAAGRDVPLADWGTLEVLSTTEKLEADPVRGAEAAVTGLRLTLGHRPRRPAGRHGDLRGLRLGTGRRRRSRAAPGRRPPRSRRRSPCRRSRRSDPPDAPAGARTSIRREAPRARAARARGDRAAHRAAATSSRCSARRRSETRSARRAPTVSGGWHHGEDIFGPLGTPLLAVADGTVFSVGWNDIGGWRLWLRDRARERVLLRAPLRLLAARRGRQARERRRRARLHGRDG